MGVRFIMDKNGLERTTKIRVRFVVDKIGLEELYFI